MRLLLASLLIGLTASAQTFAAATHVDNFRLLDHEGQSHELYYFSDMKAVVLMSHGNACRDATKSELSIQALRDQYRAQGAEFFLIDSNVTDTRDAIIAATKQAKIDMPVLLDDTQLIGESLALNKSGEVLVINPKDWTLAYRGSAKQAAPALAAVMSGAAVKTVATEAEGCPISLPETKKLSEHAKISYEKTIAPMLMDNCVACHRQGGIGPWQMTSYDMVKGFAPMIREVLRTERMPPWHADPHYGVFQNNRSLTKDQVKTLVHWIEAGAPRGEGADPLTQVKAAASGWQLGEPDFVINIPAFTVPATGVVPYQMPSVENPLDHDVWLRAVDFIPGERTVVHHVLVSNGPDGRTAREGGSIGAYIPGGNPWTVPDEAGILLKKGDKIFFQLHYTVSGKAATDVTRMGLYFRKDPPQYAMREVVLANPRLKIPANTKAHTETAEKIFKEDILLYTLTVHAHVRGTAGKFVAFYPDGREEMLLNVPRYDFNWQTTYELKTPKVLPAGTKVVFSQTWDNSVQNKSNPDPNRVVPWGEQTWDEMLYGAIRYRSLNKPIDAQTISTADAR